MTRVNLVPPSELHNKHLVAEYRELPRIFGLVQAAIIRGEKPDDKRNPLTFKLDRGHCRFFYPRLRFLQIRQYSLIEEMLRRGYKVSFRDVPGPDTPGHDHAWWRDYTPTPEALALSRARISERMPKDAKSQSAKLFP
jgi:deoxyribonuclease (pyrimidine dimer)